MSNPEIVSCPVDFITINENKARITAFFVLTLTLAYIKSGFWLIMAFLFIDFALRAFNLGKYSLLGFVSDAVIKQLSIKNKPVDRAPKRFAAGVGMVFAAAILISYFLGWMPAPGIIASVLAFFALLESFFSFCAGCYVYHFGRKITLFK